MHKNCTNISIVCVCLEYIVGKIFWSPKLLWSLPLLWVHLSRVWSRIQPLFNCFGFIANNNQPVDHDVPDFQKLVIPHNHVPSIWISFHNCYGHSSVKSNLTCQEVSHPHFLPLLLWHQHCADSPKNISLRSTVRGQYKVVGVTSTYLPVLDGPLLGRLLLLILNSPMHFSAKSKQEVFKD